MTRIYKNIDGTFSVQDKIWFFGWVDKTAKDDFGNDLPCVLAGFDTLDEAIDGCQTHPVYIHINCLRQ